MSAFYKSLELASTVLQEQSWQARISAGLRHSIKNVLDHPGVAREHR